MADSPANPPGNDSAPPADDEASGDAVQGDDADPSDKVPNPKEEQVEAPAVTPPPGQDEAAPKTDAKAAAEAEIIFHGPVSMWIGWQPLSGAALAFVVGLVLLFVGLAQDQGFLHSALVILGGALALAGLFITPYLVFSIRCLRYKITPRLIEREKGVFVRRVDSLDLARVKDVELSQSILQRILGIGTLEVYSSDKSDPVMRIEEIPNPRPVYEKLRDAVIQISHKRGIVSMDR